MFTIWLRSRAAAVAGAAILSLSISPSAGALERRDVVVITIDTLRADAVGFGGQKRPSSPHLDRFAAQGRVFPFAHAQSVLTLPSHTTILTGWNPSRHGVSDNAGFRLGNDVPTLATILQPAGYATGAFVAAFPLDSRYGLTRGFEVYDELFQKVDDPAEFRIPQVRAPVVVAAALNWWKANEAKPRFLWVHVYDPHAPYDPPPPFRERFRDDLYLGEVAAADDALAPLLEAIQTTAVSPLLVVTGDHGEARGEHGELTHGLFAYEATLHVPLLLWCPGIVPPGVDPENARHVDIVPTILSVVGVAAPVPLDGVSLLSVGRRDGIPSYFEALSASFNRGWAPLRGVIKDGFKLVDLPIPELYDLRHDPGEKRNLIESRRGMARELKKALSGFAARPPSRSAPGSEEASKLASLGYLTGSPAAKKTYGPQDDPKRLIDVDRDLHRVVELFQAGKSDAALAIARRLVAAHPTMTMGYEQLAFLESERGNVREAESVWEKAARHGLTGESPSRRRALLLCELGRPSEARRILEPFRGSSDIETIEALGIATCETGEPAKAIGLFDRVLAADPNNAPALRDRGIANLRRDRPAAARDDLEKALAANERNPRAWNALGVSRMSLGDARGAITAWDRAVSLDPSLTDAFFNIGIVAADLNDRDRARAALKEFLSRMAPTSSAPDVLRARTILTSLGP